MAAQRNGNRVIKAYLSIQNPMFVKVPPHKMADPAFENKIIAEAKSKGHDGVRLETDTNNEIDKYLPTTAVRIPLEICQHCQLFSVL